MLAPKKKKIKVEPETKTEKSNFRQLSEPKVSKSIKDSTYNSNLSENKETQSSNFDSWDLNSTCWGCREGQPNQQAHMDIGGCLYCCYDSGLENDKE